MNNEHFAFPKNIYFRERFLECLLYVTELAFGWKRDYTQHDRCMKKLKSLNPRILPRYAFSGIEPEAFFPKGEELRVVSEAQLKQGFVRIANDIIPSLEITMDHMIRIIAWSNRCLHFLENRRRLFAYEH